jgi:hypothetical protein
MTDERQLHLLSSYRLATSYPLQQTPDEVAAWLNGYAALWHPAALAGAAQAPQASSSYDHDYPRTGFVYCVPDGAHLFQPDNWPARVEEAKAIVFRAKPSRAETVERLIEALREAGQAGPLLDAPADAIAAFAGLGYGYLMLDTLYEAMDHEKLLDGPGFWADVAAARDALERGDDYRSHLRAAAEKLQAGREPVYSGSIHWLDWATSTPRTSAPRGPGRSPPGCRSPCSRPARRSSNSRSRRRSASRNSRRSSRATCRTRWTCAAGRSATAKTP